MSLVGKHLDRVYRVDILYVAKEGYRVAAFAATETMVELFRWIDAERRRALIVKGTARLEAAACPFKRYVSRYQFNDVGAFEQPIAKFTEIHCAPLTAMPSLWAHIPFRTS